MMSSSSIRKALHVTLQPAKTALSKSYASRPVAEEQIRLRIHQNLQQGAMRRSSSQNQGASRLRVETCKSSSASHTTSPSIFDSGSSTWLSLAGDCQITGF